jgi:hypothetical protein
MRVKHKSLNDELPTNQTPKELVYRSYKKNNENDKLL